MKASEFDRMFDDGEDIDHLIDWSSAHRPNLKPQRVNLDIPVWLVQRLDRAAEERGLTPDALVASWIEEKTSAGKV